MEKEEKELLEKLVKEVATQNKLLALLLCQKDFFKFNSTDVEVESSFSKYIQKLKEESKEVFILLNS